MPTAHRNRTFSKETIIADGQIFESCHFAKCVLVYRGGIPPLISDCLFEDTDWKCEDAALRTLAFFAILHQIGACFASAGNGESVPPLR